MVLDLIVNIDMANRLVEELYLKERIPFVTEEYVNNALLAKYDKTGGNISGDVSILSGNYS